MERARSAERDSQELSPYRAYIRGWRLSDRHTPISFDLIDRALALFRHRVRDRYIYANARGIWDCFVRRVYAFSLRTI